MDGIATMSLYQAILRPLLNAPMPLAELQSATQVSLPTLRRAVQELTEARWIRIVGQAEANGGRPAMLFGLDDQFFIIVGVHLSLPGMRLIAATLSGEVLDESEIFHRTVPTPDQALEAVVDYVAHIQVSFPDRRVLGIGIAAPGFTNPNSGDVISVGRVPGWENFPLCRRLQTTTGLPAHIANDIDCMAFAEFHNSRTPFEKSLIYVGFDEGVKVSLFLQGALYKGALGNAGLIAGHLLYIEGGPGRQEVDKLLAAIGITRLFEAAVAALPEAARQAYAEIMAASSFRQSFQLILQGAGDGLPVCQALVQQMIEALSAAVANVIFIVQPEMIVIGGLLSLMPGPLFASLENAIRRHLPTLVNHGSTIQQAKLSSPNSAALGATYHFVLSHLNRAANGQWSAPSLVE